MRILVADYVGHPFQVQLSRALAARGHEVLHLFSGSFETPKGELQRRDDDPPGLQIVGLTLDKPGAKENFFRRREQDATMGQRFAKVIGDYRPDVTLLSNVPVDALEPCATAIAASGSGFVFWVQDLIGEAMTRLLSQRLGFLGTAIGRFYSWRERRVMRQADHVVAISEDFVATLASRFGIDRERITVIENWAPIDDVPMLKRDNAWAKANLPPATLRIIYSGTLGMKHDPEALVALAAGVEGCTVEIFAQGAAARGVAARAAARGLANVSVRNWLDFNDLPKALASADLLVVLLEPDAGVFSVPSKVLTYLCAGRPILGSINRGNLAGKIITESGAGIVVEPGDHAGFVAAARELAADQQKSEACGRAGRAYAERTFDIEAITTRFETIIQSITAEARI